MSRSICPRCRASLRILYPQRNPSILTPRAYSTASSPPKKPLDKKERLDIATLLSKPTWSVRSLLPSSLPEQEITPTQLHHLLRLSALPQPSSPEEEAFMLSTLHQQLHFVRDIQSVDTEGIEPLESIRDETADGIKEATIGLESVKAALREEEFVGRNRRPRRRRRDARDVREMGEKEVANWDVMATAGETVGVGTARFFVVRSGKGGRKETPEKELFKDEVILDDDFKKMGVKDDTQKK